VPRRQQLPTVRVPAAQVIELRESLAAALDEPWSKALTRLVNELAEVARDAAARSDLLEELEAALGPLEDGIFPPDFLEEFLALSATERADDPLELFSAFVGIRIEPEPATRAAASVRGAFAHSVRGWCESVRRQVPVPHEEAVAPFVDELVDELHDVARAAGASEVAEEVRRQWGLFNNAAACLLHEFGFDSDRAIVNLLLRFCSYGNVEFVPDAELWDGSFPAAAAVAWRAYSPRETFQAGDWIQHATFGAGRVVHVAPDRIDCPFADGSTRRLIHGR
jgi:hypothetical protein